jgi:hypothetical protein
VQTLVSLVERAGLDLSCWVPVSVLQDVELKCVSLVHASELVSLKQKEEMLSSSYIMMIHTSESFYIVIGYN